LRALQEHRLPHRRSAAISPFFFDIYMTVPGPDNESKRIHDYSEPGLRNVARSNMDECLPNWRRQFPQIEQAQRFNELDCTIIHIEASLALRHGKSPESAELWGRFDIAIPHDEDGLRWQCMQTLHKHKDLYGAPESDPPITNKMYPLNVDRVVRGKGPIMRVAFPALPWAHALGKLSDLQEQFEEAMREGQPFANQMTARQYIDQITMYQEIFSSEDGHNWKKRAIIAWTFTKARQGESGQTSWRYVDPTPSRRSVFSPHPGHRQEMQAMMSDNFSNLYQAPPLSIQPVGHFDSILHGLATPPHTTVLQSPFAQYAFPPQPDLVSENMSFMSQATQDSDDTLVEQQHTAAHHMNNFLDGFDQQNNIWPSQQHNNVGAYENMGYLAPYSTGGAVQVWDGGDGLKSDGWGDHDPAYAYETHHLGPRLK